MQIIEKIWDPEVLRKECFSLYEKDKENDELLFTEGSHRVRGLLRSSIIRDLLEKSSICDIAQKMIEAPMILAGTQLNVVLPGSNGMPYHQDYPYFSIKNLNSNNQVLTVQVIIAIDDFTLDNGCTRYIPTDDSRSIPLLLKSGDAMIMRGDIFHKVDPNQTDKARMSLLLNFHPYWVRTMSAPNVIAGKGVDIAELSPKIKELLGWNFREVLKSELSKVF